MPSRKPQTPCNDALLGSVESVALSRRALVQRGAAAGGGLAAAAFLGAQGAAGAMPQAAPSPAKLTVWCAGYLNAAQPGTPVRRWLDDQAKRFSTAFPGSSVEYVVQP